MAVSSQDFQILKLIGTGGFGKVFLVRKNAGHDAGSLYAMKTIRKERLKGPMDVIHTVSERRLLGEMEHPFIVYLKYAFKTEHKLYLVMEYAPGGDLFTRMNDGGLLEDEARFYVMEMVVALGYLHSIDIIYRDLKPENVLLDASGHVKLADFGFAKKVAEGERTRTVCGTRAYMSPEVAQRMEHTKTVDWWGLGVVFHELVTAKLPFGEGRNLEMVRNKYSAPRLLTREAQCLLNKLLRKHPESRLGHGPEGTAKVKRHMFFRMSKISWSDVLGRRVPPPFVPALASEDDTRHFDLSYTLLPDPVDSVVESGTSAAPDQSHFKDFSYTAPSEGEEATSGVEEVMSRAEEAMSGAEEAMSGAEEATSGAEEAMSGAEEATSGAEEATSGAEEAMSGAEEATSGAEEAMSGAEEATSGAEEATSGAEEAMSGEEEATAEAMSGAEEETPGADEETPGAEQVTAEATPGAEEATSGADGETSGAEEETSGADGETSGAEEETSGAEEETSGAEADAETRLIMAREMDGTQEDPERPDFIDWYSPSADPSICCLSPCLCFCCFLSLCLDALFDVVSPH